MKRRGLIGLLGGAIAWPVAGYGQQPERMKRIGVLSGYAEDDPEWRRIFPSFVAVLSDNGWMEGQTYRFEKRHVPGGGGPEIFDAAATELVATRPDVILVVPGITAGLALLQKTSTIPIVFVQSFDPVLEGLVTSIGRPGGNITGFTIFEPSLVGKLPQLLKEIAPNVMRAINPFGPGSASYVQLQAKFSDALEQGARSSSVSVSRTIVRSDEEIELALTAFSQQPNGGLITTPDTFIVAHRAHVIALAARFRLPAAYHARLFAVGGGLLSYGADQIDLIRQAGGYVNRVLRGEKPADLPVQTPKKFELVVNLATAKALGLTIPPSLLVRADEVIE